MKLAAYPRAKSYHLETILLVVTFSKRTLGELLPNYWVDDATCLESWFNFKKQNICFSMGLFAFMPFQAKDNNKVWTFPQGRSTDSVLCFTLRICWRYPASQEAANAQGPSLLGWEEGSAQGSAWGAGNTEYRLSIAPTWLHGLE